MRTPLLAAALLVASFAARGSGQQPTFPSRVDIVTVDAVVFDEQGKPVKGLTRDDFVVREDGRPQEVAAFEAVSGRTTPPAAARPPRISTNDEAPDAAARWFFVVFDDVNITHVATPRARETVAQFIEQALRPGDRVMIAPASGGSNWIGELPQDREDLLAFVDRLQGERRMPTGPGRIWDYEAMGIALGRDKQAEAQVARRLFENNIVMEVPLGTAEARENFGNRAPGGAVAPGFEAIRILARQTYTEARSRLQTSLGTLERMAAALADARGRKTLLFFSEGFIMDTTLENFRTLLRAARNANVAIHFVDVGAAMGAGTMPIGAGADTGPPGDDRDAGLLMAFAQRESEGARALATDTGGSTIAGTNLIAGLTRVADQARSYYLLGYSPTNSRRDGRFRKIEVSVRNRPNLTVRARGGYFEPSRDVEPRRADPDALNPDVRAGLDSPFGARGIPLRMTSYVFGPQAGGRVQTLLVAEADPAALRLEPRNGRYATTLESYVLVHDRSRDSLERNERIVELDVPRDAYAQLTRTGIPLSRELLLEPGRYQATFLLRDRATGAVGSVRHEFEVPAPDRFRITTPIVTDVLQPAAGEAPRPVPIARRRFTAGTRIVAGFEILGAAGSGQAGPQVSVGYTLKRADGAQVAAAPPQALKPNARGQLAVAVGVALPADAAGDYELHLSVRDETAVRVLEHVEPLTITR